MLRKSLLLSLLFILSCSDSTTESSDNKEEELMPLSIGNQWSYEEYWTRNPENIKDTIFKSINEMTTIDGIEYYVIDDNSRDPYWPQVATNRSDGLILATHPESSGSFYPSFFKFPAYNGEIYQYQIPKSDSILVFEVKKRRLQINDTIYDCYGYYNHNIHSLFPSVYFAPGKGMIRAVGIFYTDMMRGDTSNLRIWDISSYSIIQALIHNISFRILVI